MGKVLLNFKVTVPDGENYNFNFDNKTATQFGIGLAADKLEYSCSICQNGLVVFSNPEKREIWTNREPKFEVVDGKTIVTYD
ncbi:hypothetical protein K7G42_07030 [Streptococcus parauberis]|uniref:Uncharacterized protein n=1 Tax=Streptococcus parauberis KRS-02083 TaxID=1207545 RepID=A0ABP2SZV2_9STRE|nr:hypothetical protein [Streptococcus parauberis]EMG25743.1 hypothetical protein SPJ1_1154 [Streptococcus parauberis KRS-02083]QBX27466.1 hypothetical protein Javan392_0010 [Streptococcus phage Javan392]WEM64339.1 hypothetical protein P1T45_06750 [Streptococcus parauberis]WOF46166.1 hypothetical protein K7G42_07030 [Streptococcus parauberis]